MLKNWDSTPEKSNEPIPPDKCFNIESEDDIIKMFPKLFDCSVVGCFRDVYHSIETITEKPVCLPRRRIPLALEGKVEDMIKEMLNKGIVKESLSPYDNPLVLVPKKDGSLRICLDFRKLNEITLKPAFHLPDCTEMFDKLGGNSFFSTIDL